MLLMSGFIVGCLIYLLMMFIVIKFIRELAMVVNCVSSESTKTNNLEIVVCVKLCFGDLAWVKKFVDIFLKLFAMKLSCHVVRSSAVIVDF